jgi:hypothetical protein
VGNDGVNLWDYLGMTVTAKYCVKQKRLTLTDDDTGASITLENFYSGHKPAPECNDPDKEGVKNKGPIPQGKWNIYTRPGNYKETGKPGYILDAQDKNPGDDLHAGTGRDAFRIHAETPKLGAGCVIGPDPADYDKVVNLLKNTKKGPKGGMKGGYKNESFLGVLDVVADCGDKEEEEKDACCCEIPRAIVVEE